MLTNSNRRDEKDFSGILENSALNRTFVVLIQSWLFYQDFFEAKRPDLFQNISGNYESKKNARLSKFSPFTSSLREKSSYSVFFWSLFSSIWTEYGVIRIINPFLANILISYPLKIPENLWFSGEFSCDMKWEY